MGLTMSSNRNKNDITIVALKAVYKKAEELYDAYTANDPVIHCNRFPGWRELNANQRFEWEEKARKAIAEGK